jgi:hypothetical protein
MVGLFSWALLACEDKQADKAEAELPLLQQQQSLAGLQ